jgi:hypothetical protein
MMATAGRSPALTRAVNSDREDLFDDDDPLQSQTRHRQDHGRAYSGP